MVLEVTVPDKAKLLPDDGFMNSDIDDNEIIDRLKRSINNNGEVAYKGYILPSHIRVFKTNKKGA